MDKEPDGPYVYQPYGSVSHPKHNELGRLWGVAGISLYTEIKGLTKEEAKTIVELFRLSKALGGK